MPRETSPSDPLSWDNIFSTDITSAVVLSNVASIVCSPSKIWVARSLRGDQAQCLIDLIDRLLTSADLDKKLFWRCSRLLYKICKARGTFPASYIVRPDLTHFGEFGWEGGFADVSKGEYQGRPVAVKQLRIRAKDGFDRVVKRLCREVLIWKRSSHPNILPLLGVSLSENPLYFRIISEWMSNGNVAEYIGSNPEANRLRMLSEVASGVTYIHELGIAHGDLKGANVLIDYAGTARLGDFGLMVLNDLSTVLLSKTTDPLGGTTRWMSPELLDPDRFGSDGLPSRESDSYALGMTVYEVLSGLSPFHHLRSQPAVACAILGGERPREPLDASSLGFTDTLWGLLQLCWSEPASARPTAKQLLDYLRSASHTWVPPTYCPTAEVAVDTISSDIFEVTGAPLSGSECRVQ